MPIKWYGSLFLIVLVGIASVIYSRYERQHPSGGTPPAVGTKWYAALAVDICGNIQPDLPTNPNSTANPGIHTDGDGVIRIEPTSATDAGNNATFSRFVSEYPKFVITPSSITLPGEKKRTDGTLCPAQTPDAGKPGKVQIKVWPSSQSPGVNSPTITTDPTGITFVDGQLITVAFVPDGSPIPKPKAVTITAMLQAIASAASTTTTTLTPSGTATIPSLSTTTTTPGSTTTVAPSTSTTKATTGK